MEMLGVLEELGKYFELLYEGTFWSKEDSEEDAGMVHPFEQRHPICGRVRVWICELGTVSLVPGAVIVHRFFVINHALTLLNCLAMRGLILGGEGPNGHPFHPGLPPLIQVIPRETQVADYGKHLHSEEESVLPGTRLGAIRDVAFNKSSQAQVTPADSPDLGPEVRECIHREVMPSAGISRGSANACQDDELVLVVLVAFAA
jgi:hypothetical protein